MDRKIDISVVLPVYNVEKYLECALDSVLSQKKIDLEVVAVNDGSSDSCGVILAEYQGIHKDKLVVITQDNKGLSSARNKALQYCRGEYITFVDSDDYLEPLALHGRLEKIKREALDVLVTNAYRFTDGQVPNKRFFSALLKRQPWNEVLLGEDWIIRATQKKEWPHYVYLQTIRRGIIEDYNLQFKNGIVHEDILWTTQLAIKTPKMGFLNEADYGYRKNPSSITGNYSDVNLIRRVDSYLAIVAELVSIANSTNDQALEKALAWQATKELAHLAKIVRKKIVNKETKEKLASAFLPPRIIFQLFVKSRGCMAWWRILRACFPIWFMQIRSKIRL